MIATLEPQIILLGCDPDHVNVVAVFLLDCLTGVGAPTQCEAGLAHIGVVL